MNATRNFNMTSLIELIINIMKILPILNIIACYLIKN